MRVQILSVFDLKAAAYGQPFFSQTVGTAHRSFSEHVNEKGTPANKWPADYHLVHLGEFDDATAVIDVFDNPKIICTAAAVIERLPDLTVVEGQN